MLVIANCRPDHIKPSVPLLRTAKMKETYESMKLLLDFIKYTAGTYADLKVVAYVVYAYGTAVMTKTTLFAKNCLLEHKRLWAGTT